MKNRQRSFVCLLGLGVSVIQLVGCASSGRGDAPERAEVVSAALSQIGTPYLYGGSKPGRALDCSALTQHAHRVAGVSIPRTSTAQRRAAKPVSAKALRPGDMVFFQSQSGGHVGVMVDGERFVHASTSKGEVTVSHLSTPYWRAHFVGAGTYFK